MRNTIETFRQLIFFACGLFVADTAAAQSGNQNLNTAQEQRIAEPSKARPGTYRLIIQPGGDQEFFTEDVLVIAEQLRMDHQRVRYTLSDRVSIEIYSRDELQNRQPSEIKLQNEKSENHEN